MGMDAAGANSEQSTINAQPEQPPKKKAGRPFGSQPVARPTSLQDLHWVRKFWTRNVKGQRSFRISLLMRYRQNPAQFQKDLVIAEERFERKKDKYLARRKAEAAEKEAVKREGAPGVLPKRPDHGGEKAMADLERWLKAVKEEVER